MAPGRSVRIAVWKNEFHMLVRHIGNTFSPLNQSIWCRPNRRLGEKIELLAPDRFRSPCLDHLRPDQRRGLAPSQNTQK